MSEEFLREVEADLGRLERSAGNAGALAGLRTAFAKARADAGPGPVAELARAAENLLAAQLDGYVSPSAETAGLAAQAAHGLFQLDHAARAELAERMDAVASGMDAAPLGELPPPSDTATPAPPMLTEREDGAVVRPGMFEDSRRDQDAPPAPHPGSTPQEDPLEPPLVASTTVAPQPVADAYPEQPAPTNSEVAHAISRDIDTAVNTLDRHIAALVTIASGDDETSTAVQHAAGELAATSAEIKRHSRTLGAWADGVIRKDPSNQSTEEVPAGNDALGEQEEPPL